MKFTNAIIIKIVAISAIAAGIVGCGKSSANTNSAPSRTSEETAGKQSEEKKADNPQPETAEPNGAAQPDAVKDETEKSSSSSLATPTETYKAAYAARKKKDIAALKRLMSKDALEFMSIFVEPGKTIDDALRQMTETPQAATDESRNEKIKGDTATVEYPDENGKWKTLDFVKEDGEWKVTIPRPNSPSGAKNK